MLALKQKIIVNKKVTRVVYSLQISRSMHFMAFVKQHYYQLKGHKASSFFANVKINTFCS